MELVHRVVGSVSLTKGPGFATPVFQTVSSNRAFIQRIDRHDLIEQFISIEEGQSSYIGFVNSNASRRVGDKAFYVYRDSQSAVHINTRSDLSITLRDDFGKISHFPYLQHTVAAFLSDPALLSEATKSIVARQAFRSANRRSAARPPIVLGGIQQYTVERALRGENLIVVGGKGYGKSTVLRSLAVELDGINAQVVLVDDLPTYPILHRIAIRAKGVAWRDNSAPVRLLSAQSLFSLSIVENQIRYSILRSEAIQEIVHTIRALGRRTVLIVDDVNTSPSQKDDVVSLIQTALVHQLQFVFSVGNDDNCSPLIDLLARANLFAGHDFNVITLTPLDRKDARELLYRYIADSITSEERVPSNDIDRSTEIISGFNYRNAIQILDAAKVKDRFSQEELARVAAEYLDTQFAVDLWAILGDIPISSRDIIIGLLNGLALPPQERKPLRSQGIRFLRQEDVTAETKPFVDRLVAEGILIRGSSSRVVFANRLARNWWRGRIGKNPLNIYSER